MIERIEALILTKRRTLIEGWLVQRNENSFCVVYDKSEYPHLKDVGKSEVSDVSIMHDYGDRYSADEDLSRPRFSNS